MSSTVHITTMTAGHAERVLDVYGAGPHVDGLQRHPATRHLRRDRAG
ncbi:hypothetical protein [Streptosporangium oxazolinicum]